MADYLTLLLTIAYRLAFKQAEGKNGKLFSDSKQTQALNLRRDSAIPVANAAVSGYDWSSPC